VLGNFYDILSNFDREFSKLNADDGISNGTKKIINDILENTFRRFIVIFNVRGFQDEPIFYAFKRYISFFAYVLENCRDLSDPKFILSNFSSNFPSLLRGDRISEAEYSKVFFESDDPTSPVYEFEKAFISEIGVDKEVWGRVKKNNKLFFEMSRPSRAELHNSSETWFGGISRLTELKHSSSRKYDRVKKYHHRVFLSLNRVETLEWDSNVDEYKAFECYFINILDMLVVDERGHAEKELSPLYHLSLGLGCIDGVKTSVEAIQKGSIGSTILIKTTKFFQQEEVQTFLDLVKEAVMRISTNGKGSYNEVKKSKLERERIELEIQAQRELDSVKILEAYRIEEAGLRLERMRIENESNKMELAKKKLDMLKMAAEITANGFDSVDFVRVLLDGKEFIEVDSEKA
jgi:hypothetical protein